MARILLIDDDEFFRGMLYATLTQLGHEVTEAGDGREGMACHARAVFDLIMTDLIMPEKEGIETIMELVRLEPDTRIIAMSGGGRASSRDYLVIAGRVGARAVLAKPFTGEELQAAIAIALA